MPKYMLNRSADVVTLVDQIRAVLERKQVTTVAVSLASGVSQPQISKILNGRTKKVSPDLIKLCDYANINFPPAIKDPMADPRIAAAINRVFDGTDQSIELIARLIECAGAVRNVKEDRGRRK